MEGSRNPKPRRSTRWLAALAAVALVLTAGCALLDEQQRRWVFQPGKQSWNGGASAAGIAEAWIDFEAETTPVRLHALWLPQERAGAPVMLYLHGARWDVRSSAGRMRRMHALGFSVLGIDYRGFGQSTDALPSEASALEDARAAWDWLARQHPGAARYLYGHSLGSAIAVELASSLGSGDATPAGLVLEGAFTSIPDVVAASRYGWLPVGPLITQRFDAADRIGQVRPPIVMVHGSEDRLIAPALGRALFERAPEPKRFILVDGGTHHNASALATAELREAIETLFGLGARPAVALR